MISRHQARVELVEDIVRDARSQGENVRGMISKEKVELVAEIRVGAFMESRQSLRISDEDRSKLIRLWIGTALHNIDPSYIRES